MDAKRVVEMIQFALVAAEDSGTVKGFEVNEDDPDGLNSIFVRADGREFRVRVTEVSR